MSDQPRIDYPCPWSFRLVGRNEAEIRAAVAGVLGERPYELVPSKTSAKGTYRSMQLRLEVVSEQDRNTLFRAFAEHPHLAYVL